MVSSARTKIERWMFTCQSQNLSLEFFILDWKVGWSLSEFWVLLKQFLWPTIGYILHHTSPDLDKVHPQKDLQVTKRIFHPLQKDFYLHMWTRSNSSRTSCCPMDSARPSLGFSCLDLIQTCNMVASMGNAIGFHSHLEWTWRDVCSQTEDVAQIITVTWWFKTSPSPVLWIQSKALYWAIVVLVKFMSC